MRPSFLPVPALLALIGAVAAAEPQIVADPALPPIIPQADPAVVSAASLFVSADQGATWTRAAEVAVTATGPAPVFRWTAPGDGAYAFVTPLRFNPGAGTDQPEPVPGQLPAHALQVIVDTTPPTVAIQDARWQGGAIALRWTATDAHLSGEPVTLELSTDGGRSFAVVRALPASGETTVAAAAAPGQALVRLTARDRAGLVAVTPATPVEAEVVRDPVALLQKAVASLPAPVVPGQETTAAAAAAPVVAVATSPAKGDTAAPARPAGDEPAAAPIETVGRDHNVEDRFARAAYGRSDETAGKAAQGDAPAPALPSTSDAGDRFLTGEAALALLAEARRAASAGDAAGAVGRYLRLEASEVAPLAVREEFALRRQLGDWDGLAARSRALPLHLQVDDARIDGAMGLLRSGAAAEALRTVARVPKGSPRAREAALVLGDALAATGDRGKAVRLWSSLTDGDDAVAGEARSRLGK